MKTSRTILAIFTLAFTTETSVAADQKWIQLLQDVSDRASTAFLIAYTCRDALGVAYYNAVRAYGEQALRQSGASPEAIKNKFDTLESNFKFDENLLHEGDPIKCVWMTTEANRVFHASVTAFADYNLSTKP